MESMPKSKTELLEQLRQARTALEQTLSEFGDEQMTEWKDQVGWSIKDHLDHLAAWEHGIAALLQRRLRFEAMGVDSATVRKSSEDELNEIIRQRSARRTLAQTRAALRRSHDDLVAAINALSDADLFKTYSYYQPDEAGEDSGRPIINWIIGNSSAHYMEHLAWIKALAQSAPNQKR